MSLQPQGLKNLARRAKRALYGPLRAVWENHRSARWLRQLDIAAADASAPVKVCFLLQCPELWDKLEPIYELMWEDSRFDPLLVVLPDCSVATWDTTAPEAMLHGAEELCRQRYASRNWISALSEQGELQELEAFGFDYVFYQRPYDGKLPQTYRSKAVSRWARVCYLPYGLNLAPIFDEVMYLKNDSFCRNASFLFFATREGCERMCAQWKRRPGFAHRHFEALGYPALAGYVRDPHASGPVRKLLWTPRWSTNASVGGSHFLDYKCLVPTLADAGFSVRMRPHQLMWRELVRNGDMTEVEIERYQREAREKGCEFSKNNEIAGDFEWSDAILADFSSIVIEYFLSGKPLIFCPPHYELSELMYALMEGMYVAHSWSEAERYLAMLAQGEDPKFELRQQIIAEQIGAATSAAQAITECIYNDYTRRAHL